MNPIEIRALTIAVFYVIGTGLGGVAAPYTRQAHPKRITPERLCRLRLCGAAHVRRLVRGRPLRDLRRAQAARTGRDAAIGSGLAHKD